ncbi:MAG: hypothetical protein HOD90_05455, partial [Nitrospina sp.]|nr:hypothetical protein [Nitrospina sp.]
MMKSFKSIIAWLIGTYIVLYVACFYVHVNESNIIANKANDLLPRLTHKIQTGLPYVVSVQNLKRRSKPIFWKPLTIFNSLFREGETDKTINRILGRAIENLKKDLSGSALGQMDLREAN